MTTLTRSQSEALLLFEQFLHREEPVFILTGAAGTGKTHLVGAFVERLEALKRQCVLLTPTGRAARVLSAKTGMIANTIHSQIYIPAGELNDDVNEDSELVWEFTVKTNSDSSDAVYIVDEASLVGDTTSHHETLRFGTGRLLTDLFQFLGLARGPNVPANKRKILFLGDAAQLPPVNSMQSLALAPDYISREFGLTTQRFELKEIVRHRSGSGIIKNATTIRVGISERNYNRFSIVPSADVDDMKGPCTTRWHEVVSASSHNNVLVITRSNVQALRLNKLLRTCLYGMASGDPKAGDRLMVTTNNSSYHLFNGDICEVAGASPIPEEKFIRLKGRVEPIVLRFRDVVLRLPDSQGDDPTISCKILENLLWSPNPFINREESVALRVEFQQRTGLRYPSKSVRDTDPEAYNARREQFVNSIRSDPYYNALQVKFGFAVTCHKAQGGEWDHVFVDFPGHHRIASEGFFRWAYTAITRAKSNLHSVYVPTIGGRLEYSNKSTMGPRFALSR